MTKPKFHLWTYANWKRDEVAEALQSSDGGRNSITQKYELSHQYGLEVPPYSPKDIWWLPQAQAVKLNHAIKHYNLRPLTLISPSETLLTEVPEHLLKRKVGTVSVYDTINSFAGWGTLWWKLATAKNEEFPAKLRTTEELYQDIESARLPLNSVLQYSEPLPLITAEYRVLVGKGKDNKPNMLGSSIYLRGDTTVYDGAVADTAEEQTVADTVSELLDSGIKLPPVFIVDIAILTDGTAAVLEFNPVWCSAWYNIPISVVLEALRQGAAANKTNAKKWGYSPDASLTEKYTKQPVLPLHPSVRSE